MPAPTLETDMERDFAVVTPRYLRTPDAALHLGLSPRTLEKHRCFGTGSSPGIRRACAFPMPPLRQRLGHPTVDNDP